MAQIKIKIILRKRTRKLKEHKLFSSMTTFHNFALKTEKV